MMWWEYSRLNYKMKQYFNWCMHRYWQRWNHQIILNVETCINNDPRKNNHYILLNHSESYPFINSRLILLLTFFLPLEIWIYTKGRHVLFIWRTTIECLREISNLNMFYSNYFWVNSFRRQISDWEPTYRWNVTNSIDV